ncbi:MAG: toxin-antitoxin system YwqK family antitoxin [Bacteroidota bacterium]
MKRNKNWFFLRNITWIFLLAAACNTIPDAGKMPEDPYNGVRKSYRKDGTLISSVTYKDSIRHGLARNYYRDGTVKLELHYENGKKHGEAVTYYENGDVYQVTPYINGSREGIQKKYYSGNILMAEIPFKDNKQVPGLKEYSKKGKLLTKDDRIVFRLADKTAFENKFELHMQMSDKSRHTRFSREMIDDQGDLIFIIDLETEGGKAMQEFYVRPGQSLMEKIHIVATRKTRLGNTEIFKGQYNLAIENTKRFN